REAESDEAAADDLPEDAQRGDDHSVGQRRGESHLRQRLGIVARLRRGRERDDIAGLHFGLGLQRAVDDEIERDQERDRPDREQQVRQERLGALLARKAASPRRGYGGGGAGWLGGNAHFRPS